MPLVMNYCYNSSLLKYERLSINYIMTNMQLGDVLLQKNIRKLVGLVAKLGWGVCHEKEGEQHLCVSKILFTFYRTWRDYIPELLIYTAEEASFKPTSIQPQNSSTFHDTIYYSSSVVHFAKYFRALLKKAAFFALFCNAVFCSGHEVTGIEIRH